MLLALVTAMQAIGTIFTLPSIATDLGSTPDRARLTLSLYLGGFACGQILFGALSDRHGRRPVLPGGMLLFTLADVGCALATDFRMPFAMRALQGFAGGAGMILGRAIVRDLFERERAQLAMSVLVGVMTMVPMLSPFLGGLVMEITAWRGLFVILALLSALLTAFTWLLIEVSISSRVDHFLPRVHAGGGALLAGAQCGTALTHTRQSRAFTSSRLQDGTRNGPAWGSKRGCFPSRRRELVDSAAWPLH